jgi:uncharacterized protein
MTVRRRAPLLAFLILLGALPALADKAVPFLSGRVVDEAGMIPADARQRLEGKLAAFEQKTGAQVAVLTVDSLDGDPLEDYSMRVVDTWKLGKKGKDNGVLFLVSRQDRKMRIEVGYGLEGELTDLETGRILDNVVRPDFQKGDFGGGIEHGVDAILAGLGGGEVPAEPAAERPGQGVPAGFSLIFLFVLVTFSLLALTIPGCMGWGLYVFLMPFYMTFANAWFPGSGVLAVAGWAVLFPILKSFFSRGGRGGGLGGGGFGGRRSPWGGVLWGGGGGFGGRGGGFGGGGGGFSGGGGSFGGGGASGSW